MMTKKDYKKFADIIALRKISLNHAKESTDPMETNNALAQLTEVDNITSHMMHLFEQDNPAFDGHKFSEYIAKKINMHFAETETVK